MYQRFQGGGILCYIATLRLVADLQAIFYVYFGRNFVAIRTLTKRSGTPMYSKV